MCEPYLVGKPCKKPFGKARKESYSLDLVHSNTYRPMNIKTCHEASYFLIFTNDYFWYGVVYMLSHQLEALDYFDIFLHEFRVKKELKGSSY
jgi:hypothetical protein